MKGKSKASRLTLNLLIALSSLLIPLFVFDLLLKLFRLDPQGGSRQMFLVSSYISNQNNLKYRHYMPSSVPTHVTTVNDQVEYQYQFHTDKLGFRVTYSCMNQASPSRFISIHGDSFTEGQGVAKPWIVAFQKSICSKGLQSINMAMPGNGISDFRATINLSNSLFPKAPKVLAAIDHDFFREPYHVKADVNCSRYYVNSPDENNCLTAKVKWSHIADLSEVTEQLKIAKSRKVYGLMPFAQFVARTLKSHLDQRFAFSYSLNSTIYKKSMFALEEYLKYDPSTVLLIRLPMQRDILNKDATVAHSLNLANIAQSFPNVLYVDLAKACSLNSNDFFENDPHPNQLGHDKLSRCLLRSDEYHQFINTVSP